jgi:hypothetical protein
MENASTATAKHTAHEALTAEGSDYSPSRSLLLIQRVGDGIRRFSKLDRAGGCWKGLGFGMKLTLEQRQAATAENAQLKKKRGMSAAAIARLRETKEQDTLNKSADAKLVEHFKSQPITVGRIMDWLAVIQKGRTENIRKRAIKCFYFLSRGVTLHGIHGLVFFGELLPEEEQMSLSTILNKYPSSVDAIVPSQGEQQPERLCALGTKCARAVRRKAAIVTGKGKFCSATCKGRAMRVAKRSKAMAATA